VFWPVTAIVRRRFGGTLRLDRDSLHAYRLSKVAAVLIVAAACLWGIALSSILSSNNDLSTRINWIIHLAQLLGIIGFIGGFVLTLLNLRAVWSNGARRWPARTWSIVLVLSSFFMLWIAIAFNLISFGVNY